MMYFLLLIYVVYGFMVWGVVRLLRRLGVMPGTRILASFLVLGVITGLLAVWAWPTDRGVLLNLPGLLLGDLVYNGSIRYFGDPSSPQAHFTIPWLLRVPQVYALVSVLVWGLAGLIVQVIFNLKNK